MDFASEIRGVTIRQPTSDLGKQNIDMCVEAAAGLQMQCGREYGFSCDNLEAILPNRFGKIASKSDGRIAIQKSVS